MPIEGNEELIDELRGTDRKRAFKALSRTESTVGIISRLRRQGKRLGRNLSASEGQAGVDGRDDSVHLGQQANTGADQRSSDRNDGAVEEDPLFRMGDANDQEDANLDNMEQKEFLVSLCTRYNGQKNNPNNKDKIWEYERFWVETSMKKTPDFSALLDAYIDAGLRTFNMYDDAPITLKAVLYNRFMQQAEGMASTDDFKRWYDTYYRKK